MMQKDIRDTPLYKEAEAFYQAIRQPGTGEISDAADPHCSPDGQFIVFAGTIMDALQGLPQTRICEVEILSGRTQVLTFGPGTDRSPKYAPDGRCIAFLSDRRKGGDFQLYLLDRASGAAHCTPAVSGWVEYLHWSPDGQRVLLGVAGHGADVAGGQGAIASTKDEAGGVAWMPHIETGDESYRWRRAWIYDLASDQVRQVSGNADNIWEAVWCGNDSIAAVHSPGPSEGLWYEATLRVIDTATGESRELYRPHDQIGCLSASGQRLALVEAICSDRYFVAGDLHVLDVPAEQWRSVDTRGIDVTCTEWRSERELLVAGHRGFETVVSVYDASSQVFTEVWASADLTAGWFYASIVGLNGSAGECALVGRTFVHAPEIGLIQAGQYRTVKSLNAGFDAQAEAISEVRRVTWKAPDGLDIQGWLLLPRGPAPYALIMNIHGGPVWHWRPMWLAAPIMLALKHGYAIFCPNPRGSSGRGQDFIRHVVGDMGGADAADCLSGVDFLVEKGIADPKRLGVTGGSYGGFMTAWLITQDPRFAAAVPIAPVVNQMTEHLIGNIPHFCRMFLKDTYTNPSGKYFERSPVMHSHKARTPTLSICGALDRCTPPEEAVQFHNALLENGVESVLAVYPDEGHGVRKLPAAIDCAARVVAWFEQHMPAKSG